MSNTCRIIALLLVLGQVPDLQAASDIDDIRILIDVSGSMKKTDPANLRVSALKLLNGLIPNGAQAGVWTFGRYVNMTVKWGTVDSKWRKLADTGAEQIHSNALFTNIESALSRASVGWDTADPNSRRNLIILTDGQVDISKNADKNQISRQTILDQGIKRLQKSGVHVHAIALSRNADEALLKRLALETDGSFEVAESAQQLQKIFFKMFERATSPDSIELEGNEFTVDSAVKELTLLLFRKPGSEAVVLNPPKGDFLSARRPGSSVWRSDEGYDLITIKNPVSGIWNINADIDPDNRLMVVTDLKLEATGIPNYLTPEQPIDISAALFNKGKQISKNSFLRFVDFKSMHIANDGSEIESALIHSKDRSQKGQYHLQFEQGLKEGQHTILVSADSRTFNRNKRFEIQVQWPALVSIEPDGLPGQYRLSIEAREEYITAKSLRPTVSLVAPDGTSDSLKLEAIDNVWHAGLATNQDGMYQLLVEIEALSQAGEAVRLDLGGFPLIGVFHPPKSTQTTAPKAESEAILTDDRDADMVPSKAPEESGIDWVFTSIVITAVNIVIFLIIITAVITFRRRSASNEMILE